LGNTEKHNIKLTDETPHVMGIVTFHAFYDKDRNGVQGSSEDDAKGATVCIFYRKSITDSWKKLNIFPCHTDSEGKLTVSLPHGNLYQLQIYDGYWSYIKRNFGVTTGGIIECPLTVPWWGSSIENRTIENQNKSELLFNLMGVGTALVWLPMFIKGKTRLLGLSILSMITAR